MSKIIHIEPCYSPLSGFDLIYTRTTITMCDFIWNRYEIHQVEDYLLERMCSEKQLKVIRYMITNGLEGRISSKGEIDLFPEDSDITIDVKLLTGDIISITIPMGVPAKRIYQIVYKSLPADIRPTYASLLSLFPLEQESESKEEANPTISHSDAVFPAKNGDVFGLLIQLSIAPNVPDDEYVHKWTWNGVTYLVNSKKCVWEKDMDGVCKWVGMIDLEKNIIDTTIPEPEYID